MPAIGILIEDTEALMIPVGIADDLARLGISHLMVLSGDGSPLVMLEGWAFDAEREQDAIRLLLARRGKEARMPHATLQLSLSAAPGSTERARKTHRTVSGGV